MENLSHLAPPTPTLADATVIAPERDGSHGAPTPTLILPAEADRPQSPPTIIPATDTLSTRPTRGGVAYPFRLKVEGEEGNANASTLTLQSVHVGTPGLEEEGKGMAHVSGDADALENKKEDDAKGEAQRPGVERFVTADIGALAAEPTPTATATVEDDKVERPGVERFETAREDLSTLADANGKA